MEREPNIVPFPQEELSNQKNLGRNPHIPQEEATPTTLILPSCATMRAGTPYHLSPSHELKRWDILLLETHEQLPLSVSGPPYRKTPSPLSPPHSQIDIFASPRDLPFLHRGSPRPLEAIIFLIISEVPP